MSMGSTRPAVANQKPHNKVESYQQPYTVPVQGDIVAASPNFSHMLPTVFTRPEAYEPDRFAAPRDEDKQKPYSFIGFGGGRHACIGSTFAYLQVWHTQWLAADLVHLH